MKKILLAAAAILPLVSSAPVLAGGTHYMMNMNSMSMPTSQAPQGPTQQVPTSSVTIQNFAFMPPSITVSQGTTVTWTNRDSTAHTVTGDTAGGPDSSQLQPGQSYSFTFSNAGTFRYHCSIHPQMTGTVTVAANTPPLPSSQSSGSLSTTNSYGDASSNSSIGSTSTSTSPEASEYSKTQRTMTKLPSTGPAGLVTLFVTATTVGIGIYYLSFFPRKGLVQNTSQ